MKEDILGYRVDTLSADELVADIFDLCIESDGQGCNPQWLCCLNPHSYSVSINDNKFAIALRDANWLLPDGIGVLVASFFLGGGLRKRVTGSDIFDRLNKRLDEASGKSVFFLGSTEKTLKLIVDRMKFDYPNIRVVGTYSPPFKVNYNSFELAEMIGAINSSQANVLWVAMTAPKQEKWIFDNRKKIDVQFIGAIGAVFDFYAGEIRRPQLIFRAVGLEWLVRFIRQPLRMWRRIFLSGPLFLLHIFRYKIKSLRKRSLVN